MGEGARIYWWSFFRMEPFSKREWVSSSRKRGLPAARSKMSRERSEATSPSRRAWTNSALLRSGS